MNVGAIHVARDGVSTAASVDGTSASQPPAGAPPFGRLTDVRKTFAGPSARAAEIIALESVSYDLRAGELVAFLGPSGCGKTTLLRIVAGLTRASSGQVEIRGRQVDGPQEDFGFVFQSPNLLPWRNVLRNILFPMEILGRSDGAARDRALELLKLVGLAGFAKSRPHQLSGGMKQRVALCRALIQSPALLLMDEPFGALDELTRMEMQDLLLDIRRVSGATVLFVTHSISEAIYLADEVLVFSRRPGRVIDRIRTNFVTPRTPAMRYTAEFTELERRAGAGLGILHPRKPAPESLRQ
jgi:NitT/TauT family transport system ATP-binding protein